MTRNDLASVSDDQWDVVNIPGGVTLKQNGMRYEFEVVGFEKIVRDLRSRQRTSSG